jgi:hypothetical protein
MEDDPFAVGLYPHDDSGDDDIISHHDEDKSKNEPSDEPEDNPIVNEPDNVVSSDEEEPRQTPLKIFTFIWNTESVRLGESLIQAELDEHRKGYTTTYRFACELADFLPPLIDRINQESPDIIAIGFAEDASPASYAHSHLLPNEMPKHGYKLVKRTRMMGVGVTTYKALFSFDLKMRGLRTSIYAKTNLANTILAGERDLFTDIGVTQKEYICSSMFLRNKGATGSYIRVPDVGTIAFINVHLPFNSSGLMESVMKDDAMIRYNDVLSQNVCFNEIYRNLVLELEIKPDYVIYMGDFNYRLKPIIVGPEHPLTNYSNGSGNIRHFGAFEMSGVFEERGDLDLYHEIYRSCDELYEQMHKQNIYTFEEGVNNRGPLFLPTCKLVKGRPEGYDIPVPLPRSRPRMSSKYFKLGLANQRTPSWCDRILYQRLNNRRLPICCNTYERFDVGKVMKKSDHAGVISILSIGESHN